MSSGWISWSAEDSEQGALSVDGRPVHVYWPLLRMNFSGVLLDPIRHVGTGRVGWTWRQREDLSGASSDELSRIRIAIADALYVYASEQERSDANGVAGLYRGVENMMRGYAGMDDTQLARFAVVTEYGLRLRSWGIPYPAAAVRDEPEAPNESTEPSAWERTKSKSKITTSRRNKIIALSLVVASVIAVVSAIFWAPADLGDVGDEPIRPAMSADTAKNNNEENRRTAGSTVSELVGKGSQQFANAGTGNSMKPIGEPLPAITPGRPNHTILGSQAAVGFREVNGSGGVESSVLQSDVKPASPAPTPADTATAAAPNTGQTMGLSTPGNTPPASESTPQVAVKKNVPVENLTKPANMSESLPELDALGAKKPDAQPLGDGSPKNEADPAIPNSSPRDVVPQTASIENEKAVTEATPTQNPSQLSIQSLAPLPSDDRSVAETTDGDQSTTDGGRQKLSQKRIKSGSGNIAANGHRTDPHTISVLVEKQDGTATKPCEHSVSGERETRSVEHTAEDAVTMRSVSFKVGQAERIRMLDMILPTWPSALSQEDQVLQTKAEALEKEQAQLPVSLQRFDPECGWTLLLGNDATTRRNYTWRIEGEGWRHGISPDNKALIAWHVGARLPTGKVRLVDAGGVTLAELSCDGISVTLVVMNQDTIHELSPWIACRIHKSDTKRVFRWISSTSSLLSRNIKQANDSEFSIASLPITEVADSTSLDEQLVWYADDAIWGVGLRLRIDVNVH